MRELLVRSSSDSFIRLAGLVALAGIAALTLLMLLASAGPPALGTHLEHCPDHNGHPGKVQSVTPGDLDDVVLPAGTVFCVKAGTEATGQLTADGTSSLCDYLEDHNIVGGDGNCRNVSYYVVYSASTPTPTPTPTPGATPTPTPTPTPGATPTPTPTPGATPTPTPTPGATPTPTPPDTALAVPGSDGFTGGSAGILITTVIAVAGAAVVLLRSDGRSRSVGATPRPPGARNRRR